MLKDKLIRIKRQITWKKQQRKSSSTSVLPSRKDAESKNQHDSHQKLSLSKIFVPLFFLFCAVLYIATIKGSVGNAGINEIRASGEATTQFEQSAERARYAHTYALVEYGSLSLPKPLADAVRSDLGYVDGRYYSLFAPGTAILAVPFYILGKYFNLAQVFTFSLISLFALGSLYFLFRICRDIFSLSTANSLLAPLIFAFGSTSWSYATTMYQHHLTTFFIISSFYAVWKFSKKTSRSSLWAGYVWMAYALAFTVDYPNLLFMLPIMIYFFVTAVSVASIKEKLTITIRPAFLITSICFICLSMLHGYYNYSQLGDWKRLSGNIADYKTVEAKKRVNIETSETIIADLQKGKPSLSFFREDQLPHGFYLLTVAPEKGIFFFSPIFILGILAIAGMSSRMTKETATLLITAGVNIFLYSSFGDPWGGWAFGPRYLVLSMAILSLFVTLWLASVRHQRIAKVLVMLLFSFSSAIALLGVLTTNAVPPKGEAAVLHMKYSYFENLDYFLRGESSNFLYNTYLSPYMSLQQYFILLYTGLLAVFFTTIFLVSKAKTYEH